VGAICCFTLNLNCNGIVVPVQLCVEVCECGIVPTEPSTWGALKDLYR
jgi:hypothetical protein